MKTIATRLFISLLSILIICSHAYASSTAGKYITLLTSDKQSFQVYVSGNEKAKRGVLIIPEWWGLNPDIRRWTDEFAKQGYRAMAIDLYDGKVAAEPQYARQLMQSVVQKKANARYATALDTLSKHGRKVAVIGASYGGSQALHATLAAPSKVAATIMYYPFGKLVQEKENLNRLQSPILGHFANQDAFFTPEKFKGFRAAVKQADKYLQPYIYEARHGFAKPSGKNFNLKAFQLAGKRTRLFLEKHLQ